MQHYKIHPIHVSRYSLFIFIAAEYSTVCTCHNLSMQSTPDGGWCSSQFGAPIHSAAVDPLEHVFLGTYMHIC